MAFQINTNLAAMNALMNVDNSSNSLNKSIQRLSTGMKINSAADDPAGLIISQEYLAQIGGLGQAISNSQDAMNYAKTADGALSEVSSMLNTARSLAVYSANNATLSSAALQANQSQLASIAQSITRIATTTQYGSKNLLDGSSGTSSSITDAQDVTGLNIGGTWAGASLSAGGAITLSTLTSATQATVLGATFGFATTTVASAGTFAVNGVTFTTSASSTASDIVNMVNANTSQTGVTAAWTSGGQISFTTNNYGTGASVDVTDSTGGVLGAAGDVSAAGTDATATVSIGATTVNFTGGTHGTDGLVLTDADGNSLTLSQLGNATTLPSAITIGQITVGASQFQIGANSGQTTTLALGNYSASQLGVGAVAGLNMSNLDVTTASGASNALKVIDAAINQVSTSRGQIGNFESNVLQVNINSLGITQQNLQASQSNITDVDMAAEMTNFTKENILTQAGMSVLGQANSEPKSVLQLIQNA